jgi:enoyl-CoA hydratase/carnithine racemase
MTSQGTIAWRREGGILFVSLTGVKGREAIASLSVALEDLRAALLLDQEVRVVVLEDKDGKAFRIAPDEDGPQSGEEDGAFPGSLAGPVAGLDVPVIAAIAGDAVGRGLEMALACDVRIASELSVFGMPQLENGLVPWDGGTQRLSRLVGRGKALEMLLTAQRLDAREALRIGLVQRVCTGVEVAAAAAETARAITAKAPVALRYAKEAIRMGMEMTLEQGLRLEADLYCLLQTTRDRTEGIRSFHRRKPPRFKGR